MSTTAQQPLSAPKPARHKGTGYTPGMFDHLLPPRTRARPEDIRAITVQPSASGHSVMLVEELHSGPGPRHLVDLAAEPYSAFIKLADGREVWVEVSEVHPLEGVFDEPEPAPAEPEQAQPSPKVCSFF